MYRVVLITFKVTGKYYLESEYQSECKELFEIWEEVRKFHKDGNIPGFGENARFPYILIDVPEHPHRHYRLLINGI